MLGTFLDTLGGFFNRRFLVAYWGPALIGFVLLAGLVGVQLGFLPFFNWWTKLGGAEQALWGAGVALGVTIVAVVLEGFTTPIVRLYEGYWPEWLPLTSLARNWQQKMLDRLGRKLDDAEGAREETQKRAIAIQAQLDDTQKQLDVICKKRLADTSLSPRTPQAEPPAFYAEEEQVRAKQRVLLLERKKLEAFVLERQRAFESTYHTRYQDFPRDSALIKPTRLGNMLSAAEEHPYQLYRLDAVLWWPRLTPLLPGKFRRQIDAALTPVVALLNLSLVLGLFALGGGTTLLFNGHLWKGGILIMSIGLALAWVCYRGALNQARDYGDMIRASFDLYRHEIFPKLHLATPDNLVRERVLWDAMNHWLYFYTPPWDTDAVSEAPQLAYPFFYETQSAPGTSSNHKKVVVSRQLNSAINTKESGASGVNMPMP
jgi:hypothetical protein